MGSMKVRTTLSKKSPYYISKNRRMELKYFCLQYDEWKGYLSLWNVCRTKDEWVDVTGEAAIRNVIFKRYVTAIEEACYEAEPSIYEYLLKAVTKDLSFTSLSTMHDIPCGRDFYYDRYHKFWWILSRKLLVL